MCYRERIRVDREKIGEPDVVSFAQRVREHTKKWEHRPTFFETTLAMALDHFHREQAEVIVLETGMGGRLDATNVVQSDLCVITPIALDHQKWLGETLAEIAGEKAGIFKTGVPVVSAKQAPEAEVVLRDRAEACDSPIQFVEHDWAEAIGLAGKHQRQNAALAASAVRETAMGIDQAMIARGIANVCWAGRFQRIGEQWIVDGAHNEAGAAALVQTWREEFGEDRVDVIFGAVEGKDAARMARLLSGIANRLVLTRVPSPRSLDPEELAADSDATVPLVVAQSLRDALEFVGSNRCIVAGSLFLCGEFLAMVNDPGQPFQPTTQ